MKKLLYLSLLLLTGCALINQARDNKAYTRVIGDSALSARVYNTLVISHPCITLDSTMQLLQGQPITQTDTSYSVDTTNTKDTIYLTKVLISTKKVRVVDTLKVSVEDLRQVNSLTAQTNNQAGQITTLNTQLNTANGKVSSLTTQLANSTSYWSDKWFWWFIGACVVLVLYGFFDLL